jgi:hypothetical protein
MDGMTQFKNVKKLRSKCLKLESDGSFSNRASNQEFIIHLPFFFFETKVHLSLFNNFS